LQEIVVVVVVVVVVVCSRRSRTDGMLQGSNGDFDNSADQHH
jgi:hypothetical protein